jgi:Domain of unknown function (DUF4439)
MTGPERLQAALAGEHAALYAYGRLGVLLEKELRPEAHAAEAAHRLRRDTLIVHLDQIKAPPVKADAAYALPFALTDRQSALRLAIYVEEKVSATWRSALALTSPAPAAPPAPAASSASAPANTASPSPAVSPRPSSPSRAESPRPSSAAPPQDPRGLALDGLTDAAVRATRWRKIAGVTPVTNVFPGRQG